MSEVQGGSIAQTTVHGTGLNTVNNHNSGGNTTRTQGFTIPTSINFAFGNDISLNTQFLDFSIRDISAFILSVGTFLSYKICKIIITIPLDCAYYTTGDWTPDLCYISYCAWNQQIAVGSGANQNQTSDPFQLPGSKTTMFFPYRIMDTDDP